MPIPSIIYTFLHLPPPSVLLYYQYDFLCFLCGKRQKGYLNAFRSHLLREHPAPATNDGDGDSRSNKYGCSVCAFATTELGYLSSHFALQHPQMLHDTFKCSQCDYTTKFSYK